MRLNKRQRVEARNLILRSTRLMMNNREKIHYTQGSPRWEGIDHRLRIVRGQYPHNADCSSMTTWLLWNALTHAKRSYHIPDVVNGAGWLAGYTGTMRHHGYNINRRGLAHHWLVGDEIHYGGGTGNHVALYIGGGRVFSHGSEAGPYILPVHYRSDYSHARRVILAP